MWGDGIARLHGTWPELSFRSLPGSGAERLAPGLWSDASLVPLIAPSPLLYPVVKLFRGSPGDEWNRFPTPESQLKVNPPAFVNLRTPAIYSSPGSQWHRLGMTSGRSWRRSSVLRSNTPSSAS